MKKVDIGLNAGVIWHLLSNQKTWTYDALLQASGMSNRDLNAAIGWLAREDKIEVNEDEASGVETISLQFNMYY